MNAEFFFYESGLKDAIEHILTTYTYTQDALEDHTGSAYAPMLEDMDRFMMLAHETNTEPKGKDIYMSSQMALEWLDAYVYFRLAKFFGHLKFRIVKAVDLFPCHSGRYEYLITVEFT